MDARSPVPASDTLLVTQVIRSVLAPWAARRAAYLFHIAIAAPPPFVPTDHLRARLRSALGTLGGSYVSPSSIRRDMLNTALESLLQSLSAVASAPEDPVLPAALTSRAHHLSSTSP